MIKYKCRGGYAPVSFADMMPFFTEHPRFVILDRDGTLVPYSPTPELAFLPPLTKRVLCDIVDQKQGQIAIISARGLKGLQQEFDPDKEILAGNYGMEISYPNGRSYLHPAAGAALPRIEALSEELAKILAQFPQLILDNHIYSLCLHYHLVAPHQQRHVAALIDHLKKSFSDLQWRDLPTSFEILPAVDWDKGKAIKQIAQELNFESQDFLHIVFGDSEADEPMYAWINEHGGMSFNVGEREDSQAQGSLDTPDDVYNFLRSMLDLKRETAAGKAEVTN